MFVDDLVHIQVGWVESENQRYSLFLVDLGGFSFSNDSLRVFCFAYGFFEKLFWVASSGVIF